VIPHLDSAFEHLRSHKKRSFTLCHKLTREIGSIVDLSQAGVDAQNITSAKRDRKPNKKYLGKMRSPQGVGHHRPIRTDTENNTEQAIHQEKEYE
jgi:hypothetical protein